MSDSGVLKRFHRFLMLLCIPELFLNVFLLLADWRLLVTFLGTLLLFSNVLFGEHRIALNNFFYFYNSLLAYSIYIFTT